MRGAAKAGWVRSWAVALAILATLLPALLGDLGPAPNLAGVSGDFLAGEICHSGQGPERMPRQEERRLPSCCFAGCALSSASLIAWPPVTVTVALRVVLEVDLARPPPAAEPPPQPRDGRPPDPRAPPLMV